MDFASVLKPDVYRVLVVTVLPGFIASFPWLGIFYWPYLLDSGFWGTNAIPGVFSVLLISIIVGMVVENIGSQIEVEKIDKFIQIDTPDFEKVWIEYLKLPLNQNIVASKYLSAVVTRYKFELSMAPALCSALLALVMSFFHKVGFDSFRTVGLSLFVLVLVDFFYREAKQSARLLHRLRLTLIENKAN